MIHIIEHTIFDVIKLVPFLFITYIIMEFIEHHAGERTEGIIKKSGKLGPILGSFFGIMPQCGMSAVAANFYAGKIITKGTLIAIFLSTSDEMLPILISQRVSILLILEILAIKVIIGMGTGLVIDLLSNKLKEDEKYKEIHKICENEKCHCGEEGIVKSAIKHTLQIFIYILIITLILNILIHNIGEEKISTLLSNTPFLGPIISSIVGLIPNCASSVILTELYLESIISMGSMIAGLLVNSGVGLLVLFKVNKNLKENLKILGILYIIGAISGILLELFI